MAVKVPNYYRILDVDRDADQDTIKRSFRRLARMHHPDVSRAKSAARRFIQIREAYEVLSDPEKRRQYDVLIAHPGHGPLTPPRRARARPSGGARGFSRFFRLVFGGLGFQVDIGISVGNPTDDRGRRH